MNEAGAGGASKPRTVTNAQQAIASQAAAKRASAASSGGAGSYAAGNAKPKPRPGQPANTKPVVSTGISGVGISPEIAAAMRASGSTDVSDPYNWKGIAAQLAMQGAIGGAQGAVDSSHNSLASGSSDFGGFGGNNGPSTYTPPPSPFANVGPETYTTPAQVQAPMEVFQARGLDTTGIVGPEMVKSGQQGTFGQFERQRKSRGPMTGLSLTPEELRRTAARRLG